MAETPHVDQPFVDLREKKYIINSPWFRFLDEINFTTTGKVLPPQNGGTGVTTATGTGGAVVLSIGPTIINGTFDNARFKNPVRWVAGTNAQDIQLFGNDINNASVTAVATTIVRGDIPMFFVVHDKTSGGMSLGVMDSTGGVNIGYAGIAGIAFTRLAGTGLQAAVTAGADPRLLATFAISTGLN